MIKKTLLGIILISSTFFSCNLFNPKPKLVVLMVVDHLRPDLLTRYDSLFTGGLRWLMDHGTWYTNTHHEHGYTATGPGHFVIGSGRYPWPNGALGNAFYDPKLQKRVNCVEDPNAKVIENTGNARSYARYTKPALGDWVKSYNNQSKVYSVAGKDRAAVMLGGQHPDLALYYNYDGAFITSDYYTDKNPEWLKSFNEEMQIHTYKDSLWERTLDENEYVKRTRPDYYVGEVDEYLKEPYSPTFPIGVDPGEKPKSFFMGRPWFEREIVRLASKVVTEEGLGADDHADVLFMSFSAIDWMIHDYGPYSQEIMDVMIKLDRYMMTFINHLDQKVGLENIQFVFTADHGGLPLPEWLKEKGIDAGRFDPKQTKEAREWIEYEISEKYGNNLFTRDYYSYFLNDERIEKEEANRDSIIAVIKKYLLKIDGIGLVLTPDDIKNGDPNNPIFSRYMNMLHPELSPDVFAVPEENWIYRYPYGTSHGSPYDYDTHVPLIFSHVRNNQTTISDKVATVDIAPTIAKILGITVPDGVDGSVIPGVSFP